MTLLEELKKKDVWEDFLAYQTEHGRLKADERKRLEVFVREEQYTKITDTMEFGYPVRKEIMRLGSSGKRVVYSYTDNEMSVLKLLAFLLYRYDGKLPGSCYSFRRNKTAQQAVRDICRVPDLEKKYILKADIHNYFNSIDPDLMIPILEETLSDDPELVCFLASLLKQGRCIRDGEIREEERGAMAGVPTANFLANLYLADFDRMVEEKGIPYCRYSDDMIFFLTSEEERDAVRALLEKTLSDKKLTLNPDKLFTGDPGSVWEFLGFRFEEGKIDIAQGTREKMKGKIRRKAGRLWKKRKQEQWTYERAAKAMIRSFDRKFYDMGGDGSFSWIRFYFPVITETEGLKEIDACMQRYLRYLYSGRHYKGNYAVTYEALKKLGYTPLVAEYYNWKEENRLLEKQNREEKEI